jgi:DNA-binding PadR family transcriptional regulator
MRPKRIFRPTAKGSSVLRRWLQQPVTRDERLWEGA